MNNGSIPDESLVCFDAGELHSFCFSSYVCLFAGPLVTDDGVVLEPLTRIEERCLAINRTHQEIFCMKPAVWTWGSCQDRQYCHRAHIIATPNTGPDMVRNCLLQHPDKLSETMQIIFLTLVPNNIDPEKTRATILKMIKRSPALFIRGSVVVKWAVHLSKVYQYHILLIHTL